METQGMLIYILGGLKLTALLYIATGVLALPLGLLLSLGGVSKNSFIRRAIALYTWIFRGSPLLLQLFFIYYGLPVMGITLKPFTAASLTFILNYSAYTCEILRGCIQSIPKGQYEASRVLGMNYFKTMRHIILPQALRMSLPALSNEAVNLVKDTALISSIGMAEILRNSKEIVAREFTIMPFILCGLIYLAVSSIIIIIFKRAEEKYEIVY
ncbi:amino acid ABC transporter permease [uncultured Ilyobacter sp.]|uniref:amino acid ABC transporter permease n=1 Tax=uncultured Ilyobacter sp. TaxID=544433 RepID=UPI0029C78EFA|nr:amino acid ABC transporter permease [uncultured Ilyobacter sp.]